MKSDTTTAIKIVYTSDVHGSVLPISYGNNEYAPLGLAKYAAAVKQIRAQNEHVLVFDNGDLIQGTPLMTHYVKKYSNTENPMIGIMNQIGIDAGVIGNHEFNFGLEILTNAVNQSNFPWISANIIDKKQDRPYFGPPYLIKKLENGPTIAITAVTTHYIPNWEAPEHIRGIRFENAFSTLKNLVEQIHAAENPDICIALYHGGFERDLDTGEPSEALTGENQGYAICKNSNGIDLLLTGHQHRVLAGRLHNVSFVQPGDNAKNYGEIDITVQNSANGWEVTNVQPSGQTLEPFEADPAVLKYIHELETSTQQWLDQPIGQIKGNMTIDDPFQARVQKHPFIEFIHRVQMDATGADISVTSLFNNEVSGFSSSVTMRDIVSNYMYPNTLVILEVSGQDIIDALEKSAEYFTLDDNGNLSVNPSYLKPKPQHYNYDIWEGIHYTIDVQEPIGQRIKDVTYHKRSIQKAAKYDVVLNNYRASGGGNFHMFKGKPVIEEIQLDMVELLYNYFKKHKVIEARITPNFIVEPMQKRNV